MIETREQAEFILNGRRKGTLPDLTQRQEALEFLFLNHGDNNSESLGSRISTIATDVATGLIGSAISKLTKKKGGAA